MTRTLQTDTLYLTTNNIKLLLHKIQQLKGRIIYRSKMGFQIKFENFKIAAIAHEELRKQYSVKFAYKSEINKNSDTTKITKEDEEEYQLQQDMKIILKKYGEKSNTLKQEFESMCLEIQKRQKEINLVKIKKSSRNLELANLSWNTDQSSTDETDENKNIASNAGNIMEQIRKSYKNMRKH